MAGGESAQRRVGVRDVARLAGVSSQTVSRVINQHPNIRPQTRAKVVDAMAQLDYRVNNAARSLGTRTTRTLGVIASDATLYGPAVGIAALEAAARAAGRWVATTYADAGDADSVSDAVRHLLAQGVDGMVAVAPHVQTLDVLAEAGVPVVALHSGIGASRQREGAALAVMHLADLGHRRIGRVAGPADWPEAVARDGGVDDALAGRGLVPGPRWAGDWSAAAGAAVAADVAASIRLPDGPTGIVVANDQMALGLVAGLRDAGVEVPRDLSVVGFDDNPDAAFYRPALTTVRLDLEGEARRVVAALLGEEAPRPHPPMLVVRSSTGPPAD